MTFFFADPISCPALPTPAVAPFIPTLTRTRQGMSYRPRAGTMGDCYAQNPDWSSQGSFLTSLAPTCPGVSIATSSFYQMGNNQWQTNLILK